MAKFLEKHRAVDRVNYSDWYQDSLRTINGSLRRLNNRLDEASDQQKRAKIRQHIVDLTDEKRKLKNKHHLVKANEAKINPPGDDRVKKVQALAIEVEELSRKQASVSRLIQIAGKVLDMAGKTYA